MFNTRTAVGPDMADLSALLFGYVDYAGWALAAFVFWYLVEPGTARRTSTNKHRNPVESSQNAESSEDPDREIREWTDLFAQQRKRIRKTIEPTLSERGLTPEKWVSCLHGLRDEDELENCVHILCGADNRDSALELIDSIYITVRSFMDSITSIAHSEECSSICWEVILAIILHAERTKESSRIYSQIQTLHDCLPEFTRHIRLYASSFSLRSSLRDIYVEYIEVLIDTTTSSRQKSIFTSLTRLLPIGTRHTLRASRISTKLKKRLSDFHERAELAQRNMNNAQKEEVISLLEHRSQSYSKHSPEYPVNTVSRKRNGDYTGRDDVFKDIHREFNKTRMQAEPTFCVLHGIGGVGKTQTALEFTYRYRSHYDCIFWIEAEHEIGIHQSFGAIGRKLLLFRSDNIDRAKVERVQEWLQKTEKSWLLVFDNVRSWASVSAYLPTECKANASVLVTTQRASDWTGYKILLEPLDAGVGSGLLLKQLGFTGDKIAEDLARDVSAMVGGLPLYINQAGGFIKLSQCSLSEFIQHYSSDVLGGSNLGPNWMYEKMVSAVFDDAVKELSEDSDAAGLLYMLAFLSPDGIPEQMLLAANDREELQFLRFRRKTRYLEIVGKLRTSELVHRENNDSDSYLTIHRSVQEGLLQKLSRDTTQRQLAFDRVVAMLRIACPPPSSKLQQAEVNRWPVIQLVLPHLLNLQAGYSRADPCIKGSLEFAQLLADVATMEMFDRRFIEDCRKLLETALTTLDELHEPPDIPLRADIKVILGLLTDELGITERLKGLELRIAIQEIRQNCFNRMTVGQVTREDEIRLYNTYTDLACSYQQLNRFEEVDDLCVKCYKQYTQWGAEEDWPYEYAKYYHHMAFVHVYWNQPEDAIEFAKRAADLMALAVPGAQIATVYRFDWAVILFQCGEREKAIEEHEAILESRKKECGLKNILVLQSILMLGIMYFFEGRWENAEKYLRQTLTLDRKVHWPPENVARAKFYLAQVLKAQSVGRSEEKGESEEGESEEADTLLAEAWAFVRQISTAAFADHLKPFLTDENLLFDYIVAWGYRVTVARAPCTA